MAMHVLQLGPYPPPEGGISRNMLAIRRELLEQGHTCSIIATSRSTDSGSEADVYHPRSPLALLRLLSQLEFDVLHLHVGGDVTLRVLALAFACTWFAKGKGVLTLHSGAYPLTDAAKNATPWSLSGLTFRRFCQLIAVNEPIADVFRRLGVPDNSISVIPPYSLTPPSPDAQVPVELAEFCRSHSPLLLAVGGLEKDYEPLLQIEALGEVLTKHANAGLMIVGDGSLRKDVEAEVAASGYSSSVMLAGSVEHAAVLHLIRDADILLRITLFDGDAISVREALYLGTPVIATDTAIRPEGVHLIPASDNKALVHQILSVLSAGERPPADMVQDTSNIQRVLQIYRSLL